MRALEIARLRCPGVPFIFVSGTIGEERAIDALRQGAADYVLKDRLARLVPAIQRALQEVRERESRREAERQRNESVQRFSSVADATQEWIWERDLRGVHAFCNHSVTAILGHRPEALIGTNAADYIYEPDRRRALDLWQRAVAEKDGWRNLVLRWQHKNGSVRSLESTAFPLLDAQGRLIGFRGTSRDITERIQQQEKIARLSRIHAVSSGINGMVVRVRDRQALFRDACRIAVEQGGFRMAWVGTIDPDTLDGKLVVTAGADAGDAERIRLTARPGLPHSERPACRALREKRAVIGNDIANDPAMATVREDALACGYRSVAALPLSADGNVDAVIVLFSDEPNFFDRQEMELLEQLAADMSFALDYLAKQEKLNYVSYHDPLTGLANRDLFFDRLTQMIGAMNEARRRLGVVVVDVQRFRLINGTLGRGAGDALLKAVAIRLRQTFGESPTLARISGDRFAVTVSGLTGPALAHLIENQIVHGLAEPFTLAGAHLQVACKIGVALFPEDGQDAETLFRNAEAALQRAKDTTDVYTFYSPEMNAQVAERLHFEARLRSALREHQFLLHYQPKVDLATRRICGLEALLRWRDPDRGLVSPLEFIPLLEETGMIVDVGRWVVEQAVADMRRWQAQGREVPRVAVNVSQVQVRQKDFVATVLAALGPQAGPTISVDLEVTESLLFEDAEAGVEKLRELRAKGMRIYIDDFGTGYSNLSQIGALPLDALKIDRVFIARMAEGARSTAIVSTMINLAKALRIIVVAEGVGTERQADILGLLGCDQAQGSLFGWPMPAEEQKT
jgi:diguanylate cyclase (GGDEF)-like protein/PAS domain S-box-containing protein